AAKHASTFDDHGRRWPAGGSWWRGQELAQDHHVQPLAKREPFGDPNQRRYHGQRPAPDAQEEAPAAHAGRVHPQSNRSRQTAPGSAVGNHRLGNQLEAAWVARSHASTDHGGRGCCEQERAAAAVDVHVQRRQGGHVQGVDCDQNQQVWQAPASHVGRRFAQGVQLQSWRARHDFPDQHQSGGTADFEHHVAAVPPWAVRLSDSVQPARRRNNRLLGCDRVRMWYACVHVDVKNRDCSQDQVHSGNAQTKV
ncbi:hypothetical protein DYB34_003120, partial [Aphanomyces astaci]